MIKVGGSSALHTVPNLGIWPFIKLSGHKPENKPENKPLSASLHGYFPSCMSTLKDCDQEIKGKIKSFKLKLLLVIVFATKTEMETRT